MWLGRYVGWALGGWVSGQRGGKKGERSLDEWGGVEGWRVGASGVKMAY